MTFKKTKSTKSNIPLAEKDTKVRQSSVPSSLRVSTSRKVKLRLQCQHWIEADTRPNPRKVWPNPQMCPKCKKNSRVTEIHGEHMPVTNLTAPTAPKKYKQKLERLEKGKK